MKSLPRINGECGEVNKTRREFWIFRRRAEFISANAKRRRFLEKSKHSFVAETKEPIVADDHMIEDAHAHDFADFF